MQDIFSSKWDKKIGEDDSKKVKTYEPIKTPKGSDLVSVDVNADGPEEMACFVSEDVDKDKLEHLWIVMHGKRRDGNEYWRTFDRVLTQACQDKVTHSDREIAVLAPQFFSARFNQGQYTTDQLAWDDLNAWQSGSVAVHPQGTNVTSFDVLDGFIDEFADNKTYPSLTNITFIGHGGGGQLLQRYAVFGVEAPSHLHVRYVHGDPSSSVYFTDDRSVSKINRKDANKDACPWYNTWRYGFEGFPGRKDGDKNMKPKAYFQQYLSRDVISIVGYDDKAAAGDRSCMAYMQGGGKRRDRNLVWYRYINELARTGEDLDGFPGEFENLPDWSHLVNGTSGLRLVVVENASHNVKQLFKAKAGQNVLFNDFDIFSDKELN
ncbi:uncharacterized protein F5Z01DRAFT_680105 [Emericellopsis atlantica]|uniref:Uncharacterized protein n=1 Tax=Emericellopsis atlantica TaxID=2614577 RepID=A0A9P8CR86_9HYPO|nr:uncharacterized protein F5Z01DRAFT_680105 [Emericellopsis atlantica]KAG9256769.1 hypothetical protein F5Z01DRAFT_680105 [Emericellopsis atlantica]